jgi:hypothetical protein
MVFKISGFLINISFLKEKTLKRNKKIKITEIDKKPKNYKS